ncbi:methyl-accepting chemotaxis protein [Herbaspirillum sp. Sphag1AN]|uniref:methyl-accepting chemotaxis protein n=1 Tax=unclassified Herbaspirillum TaxID=2624150 RepID=UPI0017F58288|nr:MULTISPECIES: methyl-accepting chemotaxis protein [unclassified Herbaspirillum]MBB3211217.1 methyl-accepting chemotaxis protein [Herbaspirillum sp. Sphag1AN]MBB3244846.1 methyl-accepting chemotaxis protein [Herbaspirillum sp. Sphag64]
MRTNLKISSRLALAFFLVLLCAAAILLNGLWRMSEMQSSSAYIIDQKVGSMTTAMSMRESGSALALALRKVVTPTDAAEGQQENQHLAKILEAYVNAENQLGKLTVTERGHALLQASINERKVLFPIVEKARELVGAGNYFDAGQLIKGDFAPAYEKWMATVAALAAYQQVDMASAYSAFQGSYHIGQISMITIGALTLVLGAFFTRSIGRRITVSLRRAGEITDTIASGDLTTHITESSQDEAGQLVHALNSMQRKLASTVQEIKQSASVIAQASEEIAHGNADLSNRTESQASSLEETASSMEQLTSTVKQNADNAHQANQLVISASDHALKGGKVVADVVETMGSIKSSSSKIVDIIGVIDGIAFQTNILALNAAVEAARAGEQGRGFAVVASEVRALAQRSAAAAKEIKILISDSVSKVEAGGRLVDEAGLTMNEIVSSVQHVADIMGEITAASNEQSAGIAEVNHAITQIDEITQQNAALVEQAAAAAESLQEQAEVLARTVAVFKIDQTDISLHTVSMRQKRQIETPVAASIAAPTLAIRAAVNPNALAEVKAPRNLPARHEAENWEEF